MKWRWDRDIERKEGGELQKAYRKLRATRWRVCGGEVGRKTIEEKANKIGPLEQTTS